jgi:hypothetical protein
VLAGASERERQTERTIRCSAHLVCKCVQTDDNNNNNRLLLVHCVRCERKGKITATKHAARSSGKLAA